MRISPEIRAHLSLLQREHINFYLDRLWTCYVAGPVERAVPPS